MSVSPFINLLCCAFSIFLFPPPSVHLFGCSPSLHRPCWWCWWRKRFACWAGPLGTRRPRAWSRTEPPTDTQTQIRACSCFEAFCHWELRAETDRPLRSDRRPPCLCWGLSVCVCRILPVCVSRLDECHQHHIHTLNKQQAAYHCQLLVTIAADICQHMLCFSAGLCWFFSSRGNFWVGQDESSWLAC